MKRMIYIVSVCACILKIISCSDNSIDKTLDRVENIAVRNPDSALILLDSIKYPFIIKTKKQQAQYAILSMYARDLNDMDIPIDTTITNTIAYLKKTNNTRYLAYAQYYLGRIYLKQENYEKAMKSYVDAQKTAQNTDDDNIKGLILSHIGELYYNQGKYDDAIKNFKLAQEHLSKSKNNYKKMIALNNGIGNSLLLEYIKDTTKRNKARIDSIMGYYNDALLLTRTAQDSAKIIQNIGTMYLGLNQLDKAKQQLFQALKLNSDSILQSTIYLNLAVVYEAKNLIDSAIYYAKLSEFVFNRQKDNRYLVMTYETLSRLEKKNCNYSKSLEYKDQYMKYYNCITKNILAIYGLDIKYELKMFKEEASVKHRFFIMFIVGSYLVFATIVCLFIMRNRKKNSELEKNNLKLSETKHILANTLYERDEAKTELSETKSSAAKALYERDEAKTELSKTKNSLTEALHERDEAKKLVNIYHNTFKNNHKDIEQLSSDIKLRKILSQHKESIDEIIEYLESLAISDQKFKKQIHYLKKTVNDNETKCTNIINYLRSILYKSNTWEFIYFVHKEVFDKIKEQYNNIKEHEYKIICLEYIDYTNDMIANVINLKAHSVAQIKSKIRHDYNIGKRKDIAAFTADKLSLQRKNNQM